MRLLLIIILFSTITSHLYTYKAVIITPVADLIGQPITSLYPKLATLHAYNHIPLCGGTHNRWLACPRIEQLLYNEIVDVLETNKNEVKVRIPNAYYVIGDSATKQTDYWMLKKNCISLNELHKQSINTKVIPATINFNNPSKKYPATIVLTMPYHDKKIGLHFSAGTRFIRAKTPKKSSYINVFAYNPHTKNMEKITIPKSLCLACDAPRTKKRMRELFVKIAQQWAHCPDGVIPYNWGGCSVVHIHAGPFGEHTMYRNGKQVSFFSYGRTKTPPHTGLDCAGLVARAAQIAGIPYFYKNTHTLARFMDRIQKNEHLQNGDLLWTPGHVMIVSDRDNNMLVEARSYFQGYGRVHEILLNKVFKDINTYDDLEHAFFTHKPLKRMDINGVVRNTLPNYALLKLESVWK